MTTSEFLRTAWSLDPLATSLSVLLLGGYAAVWPVRDRLPGKGEPPRPVAEQRKPSPAQLIAFSAGFVLVLSALASPVGVLANRYLFSAHMLQHLILLLLAPALVLLSLPRKEGKLAEPKRARAIVLHWLPGVGAMWLWHTPQLCSAAQTSQVIFSVQAASLLFCGTLFWWPILGPDSGKRLPPLSGIVYLFTACFACTLLGIYITFTPLSVCPAFLHPQNNSNGVLELLRTRWGLDPATDQRVGGLMMWVPACSVYLAGILGLLGRWYASGQSQRSNLPLNAPQPKET